MRDEKEERKKQARSNKQTRQSNTAHPRHASSHCIYMYMYMYLLSGQYCKSINTLYMHMYMYMYTLNMKQAPYTCTCTCTCTYMYMHGSETCDFCAMDRVKFVQAFSLRLSTQHLILLCAMCTAGGGTWPGNEAGMHMTRTCIYMYSV